MGRYSTSDRAGSACAAAALLLCALVVLAAGAPRVGAQADRRAELEDRRREGRGAVARRADPGGDRQLAAAEQEAIGPPSARRS